MACRRYTLPDIATAAAAGPGVVHAASKTPLAGGSAPAAGGAHFYELPRINKAVAMRPYQYTYTVAAASSESPWMDALVKASTCCCVWCCLGALTLVLCVAPAAAAERTA
jgi:hypothetical protein